MPNDAKVYNAWTAEWEPAKTGDKEAVTQHEAIVNPSAPPAQPPKAADVGEEGPVATTASAGTANAPDAATPPARGRNAG